MTVNGGQQIAVATDLDGTLLVDRSAFLDAFEFLHGAVEEFGGELIIATSRSPHDVTKLVAESVSGIRAVCFDGACIVDVGEETFSVTHEWTLDASIASETVELMRAIDGPEELFMFGSSAVDFTIAHVGDGTQDSFDVLSTDIGVDRQLKQYASPEEVALDIGFGNIRAITWFGETDEVHAGATRIDGRLPAVTEILTYPEVRYDGYSWLDVVDGAVNKGRALEALLGEREDVDFVLAFGNAENDIPMFEYADEAISPSDADPSVKRHATEVAPVEGGRPFGEYVARSLPRLAT